MELPLSVLTESKKQRLPGWMKVLFRQIAGSFEFEEPYSVYSNLLDAEDDVLQHKYTKLTKTYFSSIAAQLTNLPELPKHIGNLLKPEA